MANSMAILSRRVCRSLLSNPKTHQLSMPFCTTTTLSSSPETSDSDTDSPPSESSTPSESFRESNTQRLSYDSPLENGLDIGIYKAILVGQVGQAPVQKKLKSGMSVTMFSVGTGGIHNNRRPHENEEPVEYANRCAVQWHRVRVYQESLGGLVLKHAIPGTTVYLEGNLETKIFSDPITGLVRRVREISVRRNVNCSRKREFNRSYYHNSIDNDGQLYSNSLLHEADLMGRRRMTINHSTGQMGV